MCIYKEVVMCKFRENKYCVNRKNGDYRIRRSLRLRKKRCLKRYCPFNIKSDKKAVMPKKKPRNTA